MATTDDQINELLALNANFFRNFNRWSEGMVQVLAGTADDPNSFAADGTKNGDLGYYPVVNVSGQTIYVPCLLRMREIARSLTPAMTMAQMRALTIPLATGAMVQLHEAGRAGMFRYSTGDMSAKVAADPDGALFVAPNARSNGTLGAWVRIYDQDVQATWAGLNAFSESADLQLNRLMLLMNPGDWLVLPPYEMGIQGKVTIPAKINVRGLGNRTSGLMARTAGKKAFHAVHNRYSDSILMDFYAGGVKGQQTVGEACAFHAYPGEVNQPATVTADISNIRWWRLRAVDAETGYRWGYNVTDTEGNGKLFHAKLCSARDCDSDGILGHNLEIFTGEDVQISGGDHYLVPTDADGKAAADPPKMLRIIGARRLKVSNTRLFGHGTTNGSAIRGGVYLELANPYSKLNYAQLPGDIQLDNVDVSGCPSGLYVTGLQGSFSWRGGILRSSPQTSIALRVTTTGWLIQPQVVRDSPPPDTANGEKGIKFSAGRITLSELTLFNWDTIGQWEGKIDLLSFADIEAYNPNVTAGRSAFQSDKGGNDLDIFRVRIRNVRDYANRTVPTFLRVNDGRRGSEINIDDCVASVAQNTAQRTAATLTATAQSNVAVRLATMSAVRRIDPAVATAIAAAAVEKDSISA